jgi:N6-L-threonylcarbamoyladenine synthase
LAYAKGLAYALRCPLVAIDHIAAHTEAAFITHPQIQYPVLSLVVSGGHTSLFLYRNKFECQVLAKTRDDAVGEVLDKIAKHFHLPYPGGPVLDRMAAQGDRHRYAFAQPKMTDGSFDFSFSGYKSAALRLAHKENLHPDQQGFLDLIASFYHAMIDGLVAKVLSALEQHSVHGVILAGGVACSARLRERFSQTSARQQIPLYLTEPRYCTDNAAMIAWLGYEKWHTFPHLNYFDYGLNAYSRATFRTATRHR